MQKQSSAQRLPGQDRNYDGKHVLVFDHNALRSGDVMLTMNATASSPVDRTKAKFIALTTGGMFSHALICTTPPTLVEAISGGVSSISSLNCFVHHPDHVRVLRYRDEVIASKASSFASAAIGTPYSVLAAMLSITTVKPDEHQGRIFCSALVAASFKRAGAPEFASISPYKVTPAGLMHFGLQDVTRQALRAVLAPKNVETLSALDGDRAMSPMAGQAALLNEAFNKFKPSLMRFWSVHYLPGSPHPTSFFDCLSWMEGGMRFAQAEAGSRAWRNLPPICRSWTRRCWR